MKLRYLALPAVAALLATTPALADKVDCRPADRDTTLCLKTGGWTEISGTDRDDELIGTKGRDQILGDGGDDRIYAGSGSDDIDPGDGKDYVEAGRGNDVLYTRDGVRDEIDCGPGRDTIVADTVDRLKNCEKVTRKRTKDPLTDG
jgi:Ca2+-binding RTX toxin-like protein